MGGTPSVDKSGHSSKDDGHHRRLENRLNKKPYSAPGLSVCISLQNHGEQTASAGRDIAISRLNEGQIDYPGE
jgi:hypothetical protein